jgi:hypothetical protein
VWPGNDKIFSLGVLESGPGFSAPYFVLTPIYKESLGSLLTLELLLLYQFKRYQRPTPTKNEERQADPGTQGPREVGTRHNEFARKPVNTHPH